MAKKKLDGVIEAVHYEPDGKVKWVRLYLRRGKTFTDRVMMDREALIESLKSGKNFYAGERVLLEASTFKISDRIQVVSIDGREVLSSGGQPSLQDNLGSVPII